MYACTVDMCTPAVYITETAPTSRRRTANSENLPTLGGAPLSAAIVESICTSLLLRMRKLLAQIVIQLTAKFADAVGLIRGAGSA